MDEILKLDNEDKIRISSNINALKNNNIPYLEYMVNIPINSLTQIKTKEEIINKMLIDFIIASSAYYMIKDKMFYIGDMLDTLNKKYNTDRILNIEDKMMVVDIINKLYTIDELEKLCLKFESVNVCLWSLGFINELDSFNRCDINNISKIIFKYKNYIDLSNSCKKRSKEEILKCADLVTRYYWAIREAREDESVFDKLNENVVNIQSETLDFITSYSYDSLNNKRLKIEFSKDDLSFEFEIPSTLSFDKISNSSKELMALKSSDGVTRIVVQNLGIINDGEYYSKVDKYTEMFIKNGFTLLGNYQYYSNSLNKKIICIVIRKGNTSLNSYFINVSNHLIRLDSLIESYVDASSYKEIINANNTKIDLDIVLSIKEVK